MMMLLILMTKASVLFAAAASGGSMINTTKARYVETQKAHHIVLGSSSKRWPSQRLQMANIRLPSIRSDCSGIDIFQGAISFIKADELVSMLKNIGSASTGFAFYLALETVSPQIASGIKHLAKVIQDMNALNIGSCEGAAALIGAVVPRNSRLGANTCKILKNNNGKASDFVAAQTGCNEGHADRTGTGTTSMDTKNELADVLQEASNVAWYVLKQTGWDEQLKETLMSVTGTVITGDKTSSPDTADKKKTINAKFEFWPPLALNDEFFAAFATGGKTDVYKCDEKTKCLTITKEERVFSIGQTHAERINNILESIESKIYTNTALDQEETNLIEQSRIPILKIINVMSSYHKGKAPISIQMYVNIIAHDLLTQHIRHMVNLLWQISSSIRGAQINEEALKEYIGKLQLVEKKLKERDEEVNRHSDQILQIIQKTHILEKHIYANMRVLTPGG